MSALATAEKSPETFWPAPKEEAYLYFPVEEESKTSWQPAKGLFEAVSKRNLDMAYFKKSNREQVHLQITGEALTSSPQGTESVKPIAEFEPEGIATEDPFVRASLAANSPGSTIEISGETDLILEWVIPEVIQPTAFFPKVNIRIAPNSQVRLFEIFRFQSNQQSRYVNSLVKLDIAQNARAERFLFGDGPSENDLCVMNLCVALKKNAAIQNINLLHGSGKQRENIFCDLDEERSEGNFGSLHLAGQNSIQDHFAIIRHRASHTVSTDQLYSVTREKGVSNFCGRILVEPNIKGASSSQNAKGIPLSDGGKIQYRPELEIYSDEIECSHGASIGQLDLEAIRYMRSRGLSEEEAKSILIGSFQTALLDTVADPLLRESMIEIAKNQQGADQ